MKKILSFLHRHRFDVLYILFLIFILGLLIFVLPKEQTKIIIDTLENKTFDIRQSIIAKDKKINKDFMNDVNFKSFICNVIIDFFYSTDNLLYDDDILEYFKINIIIPNTITEINE